MKKGQIISSTISDFFAFFILALILIVAFVLVDPSKNNSDNFEKVNMIDAGLSFANILRIPIDSNGATFSDYLFNKDKNSLKKIKNTAKTYFFEKTTDTTQNMLFDDENNYRLILATSKEFDCLTVSTGNNCLYEPQQYLRSSFKKTKVVMDLGSVVYLLRDDINK